VQSGLFFLLTTGKEQAFFAPDTKKPGMPFGPGASRQFQFHE
jgi:hypothetical protein